ncbi:thiamine phosphate synthase [Edaphobacter aggregans]|uniref:thiamine phosphate synthase n=1 Tax=Edaphobacter aggregans TaxID=570835 RepID=UPI00068A29C5|nr:thiamine phosphate synthase [Edaphobacter aggregans]
MLRCAITDRTIFPGDDDQRIAALIHQASLWSQQGIEIIQLREKDLPASDIADIARQILKLIASSRSILIINTSVEAAIAARAPGVHISSHHGAISQLEVRRRFSAAGLPDPIITISCHSLNEIRRASVHTPDAILFAPVFGKVIAGKTVTPAAGLRTLSEACQAASPIPVLALGGVTLGRAQMCLNAGAAGIAGIRIFHNYNPLTPDQTKPSTT